MSAEQKIIEALVETNNELKFQAESLYLAIDYIILLAKPLGGGYLIKQRNLDILKEAHAKYAQQLKDNSK